MWTVVYIAPNGATAELIKNYLESEGILVMLRPIGPPHLGSSASVEVMVPFFKQKTAYEILYQTAHPFLPTSY